MILTTGIIRLAHTQTGTEREGKVRPPGVCLTFGPLIHVVRLYLPIKQVVHTMVSWQRN
jgi:hypothetical protein